MRTKARFGTCIRYVNGKCAEYSYRYLANALSSIINEDKIRPIDNAYVIDLETGVVVAQYKMEVAE